MELKASRKPYLCGDGFHPTPSLRFWIPLGIHGGFGRQRAPFNCYFGPRELLFLDIRMNRVLFSVSKATIRALIASRALSASDRVEMSRHWANFLSISAQRTHMSGPIP
jgi:hypothetical protein